MADLLAAKGPVHVPNYVVDSVFGGMDAYKKLCSIMQASTGYDYMGGTSRPVYWYDFLSEVA